VSIECMRRIARQLAALASRLGETIRGDRPFEVHSPILASSVACFIAWVSSCCVSRYAVAPLHIWWAGLMLEALVPILLTFAILYRSSWHPQTTGPARTLVLTLLSCAIFGAVLFAAGIAIILASLVFYSEFDDFMRFHC